MSYEMDTTHRIYSGYGFFYEIGLDPDGLVVEIRYFEDEDEKTPKFSVDITQEAIPFVIKALEEQLKNLREKSKR